MLSTLNFSYNVSQSGRNLIKASFRTPERNGVVGGIMLGFDLVDRKGDPSIHKCAPCMTHELQVYPVLEDGPAPAPIVFQVELDSDWEFLKAFRSCAVKAAQGGLSLDTKHTQEWSSFFPLAICTSNLLPRETQSAERVAADAA